MPLLNYKVVFFVLVGKPPRGKGKMGVARGSRGAVTPVQVVKNEGNTGVEGCGNPVQVVKNEGNTGVEGCNNSRASGEKWE